MLGRAEIARLIPHKGAMVLLDTVENWTDSRIVCATQSHRRADNPLRRDGRLSAICGVEYGAQAMAVHGGLIGGKHKSGYLASLRNVFLHVDWLDDVETAISVTADLVHLDTSAFVYDFSLAGDGSELVSGRATVFVA